MKKLDYKSHTGSIPTSIGNDESVFYSNEKKKQINKQKTNLHHGG